MLCAVSGGGGLTCSCCNCYVSMDSQRQQNIKFVLLVWQCMYITAYRHETKPYLCCGKPTFTLPQVLQNNPVYAHPPVHTLGNVPTTYPFLLKPPPLGFCTGPSLAINSQRHYQKHRRGDGANEHQVRSALPPTSPSLDGAPHT